MSSGHGHESAPKKESGGTTARSIGWLEAALPIGAGTFAMGKLLAPKIDTILRPALGVGMGRVTFETIGKSLMKGLAVAMNFFARLLRRG